ncbi:hypothetical protein SAMN05216464_103244 [Mucilaginibacter pineti]|uniref:Histidine phosphatase superfamily (Branch 1) n=1 Tax=Mucilaginibacter pineti TaxID=1391627 RepID=A0A1G6Z9B9_9SPHI|nr:histidine phosphatase family protein [Mucilaginibacter pineti]SDD98475.1 hypothetical protein SAMN05216464_103244 [Mucilaginibacter pineti]
MKFAICCLVLFLSYPGSGDGLKKTATKELKTILIRHGEKPDDGDNLSCRGLNRSFKLVNVLYSRFGKPDYIYVPAPGLGKKTKNCRMLQTILPFAVKYNSAINTKYSVEEADQLATELLSQEGTIFVIWEHNQLPSIVKSLGVKGKELEWKSSDYDSIWIVKILKGAAYLSKEKENIAPSDNCSF